MASLRNRRIGNNGHSFGTVAIYSARSEFWTYGQGDYEIQFGVKSFPEEMRAYRKRAKKAVEKSLCETRPRKMKSLSYLAALSARSRQ